MAPFDTSAAITAALDGREGPAPLAFQTGGAFTLQLFHAADQEGGVAALQDAPRFSAVLNALRAQDVGADATLTLSAGDAYIPGVFAGASAVAFGGVFRGDILINNALGFEAIAFGNHEFDLNTSVVRDLIAGAEGFVGAQFTYLSSNLDFSTDANLDDLVVAGGQAPQPNAISSSVVIEKGGELIGVVGATTPILRSISSPGGVTVDPAPFGGVPTDAELDALAAIIQAEVDALLAANPTMNKVVLLAHMQQIAIEQALADRLQHVDVIVAGGSNTRLFDADDRVRDGDTVQGAYPIIRTAADGRPVAVVNTDGGYKYVGRLVVDFDENGVIIPESYDAAVSGAYATDAQGVAALDAAALVDPAVQAIVDELREVIVAQDGNFFGVTSVFLNGSRPAVRQQETNLGNLTADANLDAARKAAAALGEVAPVVLSIKNGGGIRASIGDVVTPPGGTTPEFLPPEGNALAGRPDGGMSQTAIQNALAFNNNLALITVTKAELVALLEHGVFASTPTNEQGRFPQVAGVEFSFDLTRAPGDRIVSAALVDEAGVPYEALVRDGEIVGDADASYRIVTLGFLANGGDGYPFPRGAAANLTILEDTSGANVRTGVATFANDGTEQDALAEYLAANFSETPFAEADTPREQDERIQNLAFREDAVFDGFVEEPAGELIMTEIVEGSSNNKAIELTNFSDEAIDLAAEGYTIQFYFNGQTTAGTTIALTGSVEAGGVFVLADNDANAEILALADQTATPNFYNGDDAIVLRKNGEIVDSFGTIGVDPGSEWPGGGQDDTLRRKDGIITGDADATDAFSTGDEWDVFGQNDISDLGDGDTGGGEGPTLTLISAIQGAGAVSPLAGQRVTVEAVVTVVSNQLNGFFLQEEGADSDGNDATSEGVFVFTGSDPTVQVGDRVRFSANVSEFFNLTQLSGLSDLVVLEQGVDLPPAFAFTLPLPDATDPAAFYESLEGMLVRVTAGEGETLRVTDAFTNFGEVGVTGGAPLVQPTQAFESFSPEAEALEAANNRNILVFENAEDDSLSSAPRVGDGIVGGAIEGAMNFTFSEYKVATQGAVGFDASVNPDPRQEAPEDVGGRLKVASFNVLNYFTTLGERGAETAEELAAQTAKIVAAITAMDADVLGLIEIENDLSGVADEAVATLVAAVNAALGSEVYSYIATGKVGTDEIKQAILYKTATVAPKGDFAVLDDEAFTAPFTPGNPQSRPAIAQTFEEIGTGEAFTVSVNHLKSKGSATGAVVDGEADDNPVEGSAALTRVAAMKELAAWIASDPTGSGDADHITLGDFNAYAMERAIKALEAEGFTNLAADDAISYYFNGEGGTLDYAFANESLLSQITGATIWNINSPEAYSIQYNGRDFAAFGDLSAFASSDHDPVIVGLDLSSEPELNIVAGGVGSDRLIGTDGADAVIGGAGNNVLTGAGAGDVFVFGQELANGRRELTQITDYDADEDMIDLGGFEVASFRETRAAVFLTVGEDGDQIIVRGLSDFDQIRFVDDLMVA